MMNNCKQNCDKGFNIVDVSFYYSIHIFMFFKLDVLAILTLRVLSSTLTLVLKENRGRGLGLNSQCMSDYVKTQLNRTVPKKQRDTLPCKIYE